MKSRQSRQVTLRRSQPRLAGWVVAGVGGFLVLSGSFAADAQAQTGATAASVQRQPVTMTLPRGLSFGTHLLLGQNAAGDEAVVVDRANHRIVAVEWAPSGDAGPTDDLPRGAGYRTIGRIGNARGEFYYPNRVVVDRGGRVYVLDDGNRRVQLLTLDGDHVDDFPFQPPTFGMAADGEGIYVNELTAGRLVTVYDQRGRRVRKFGWQKTVDQLRESKRVGNRVATPYLQRGLNRARLVLGRPGELWVVYLHAPVIQKWTTDGALEWERMLDDPDLAEIAEMVWTEPPSREHMSIGDGHVQLTVVLKDASFDTEAGELVVLTGDDRLLRVSDGGSVRGSVVLPRDGQGRYLEVGTGPDGVVVLTRFRRQGLYYVDGRVD